LPIISPAGERVIQRESNRVEIVKPGGTVVIAASVPLRLRTQSDRRDFNLIPGFEALTFVADLPNTEGAALECSILVTAPLQVSGRAKTGNT
jgi:hypothetical protein